MHPGHCHPHSRRTRRDHKQAFLSAGRGARIRLSQTSMLLRLLSPKLSSTAWAVLGFLILAFSPSRDSIDMMESQTWDYARHDTAAGFFSELQNDTSPESQMPLGMFSFWAWARAFGTGELAMRSLNLLWAAIALAALARVGRQLSISWLPLLFAIQPFLWYYTDYARTPLMQIAGGSLLLTGAIGYLWQRPHGAPSGILLCLGAVILSGANMFGLIPLAAVAAGLAAHGAWRKIHLPTSGKAVVFATTAVVAALSVYYALTFIRGTGGNAIWTVSPFNLLFAVCEFLGFQGLAPGRQEIRCIMKGLEPASHLLPFLPGLLILAASYLVLIGAALRSWMTRESSAPKHRPPPAGAQALPIGQLRSQALVLPWMMGMGVPLLSGVILYLVATIAGIPFWGRHLAGAFPFWVLALAITIHWGRQGLWRKPGRLAAWATCGLLVLSSLLIRFASHHAHDDYRGAAAEALRISSQGGIVWWVADHSGGLYYGLPLASTFTDQPGEIQFSMNRSEPGSPDAIVISRLDIFDSQRTARSLMNSGHYKKSKSLQAFEIWEKEN